MDINFDKITIKINEIPEEEKNHPNMLANAFLTLKNKDGEYWTISGFTVWKSRDYDGYNVTLPQNSKNFKYCSFEKSFWGKLKRQIIKEYECSTIPIVEEKDTTIVSHK